MTLIADSGSTKTEWGLIENHKTRGSVVRTQGINPAQQTAEEIETMLRRELVPQLPDTRVDRIHFYGAGCLPATTPAVEDALRAALPTAEVRVESDMVGAARAACGHTSGVVCILGTGSNSCFYDGCDTHPGVPSLGFILGDEGGGAYLGRRLVGDLLKGQMPAPLPQLFFEETALTTPDIIRRVYREPMPGRFLASLSPFCARHRSHPAIHTLLLDCFTQFLTRNILPAPWSNRVVSILSDNQPPLPIHFVGSIAHHYQDELREACAGLGLHIGTISQSPLPGLLRWHANV